MSTLSIRFLFVSYCIFSAAVSQLRATDDQLQVSALTIVQDQKKTIALNTLNDLSLESLKDCNIIDITGSGHQTRPQPTPEMMKKITQLPRLTHLQFTSIDLTDDLISHLSSLTNLQSLSIGRGSLTSKSLIPIGRLTSLEALQIRAVLSEKDLTSLKNLHRLNSLAFWGIESIDGFGLISQHFTNLTCLQTSDDLTIDITALIKHLKKLPRLTILKSDALRFYASDIRKTFPTLSISN
jgi:hypothetical protein